MAEVTTIQARAIRPEDIVWIFGFGRSGSSWLRSLMAEPRDHQVWEEPLVGRLFGCFHAEWCSDDPDPRADHRDFVLAGGGELWLGSIRAFVLERINAQFSGTDGSLLVVKEPNGSQGAPLLMKALPESRMVLLVRDPRDVMASVIAAHAAGGWAQEAFGNKLPQEFDLLMWCDTYMTSLGCCKRAYDAHQGRKVLVKYEQLIAEPVHTLGRIYDELGIALPEQELAEAVEKHSWGSIPDDQKGPGKAHRKASPGGWRDDLSEAQRAVIEGITAPILREYYPEE